MIVVFILLNFLFFSLADVLSISDATVLLPPDSRASYVLTGQGGCFVWRSHNTAVATVRPLPAEASLTSGDSSSNSPATATGSTSTGSEECSTRALVVPVASAVDEVGAGGRAASWIVAEDVHSGRRIRCEVFVDRIARLSIDTHSRRMNAGDVDRLSVDAFDLAGNSFSNVGGVPFSWTLRRAASTDRDTPDQRVVASPASGDEDDASNGAVVAGVARFAPFAGDGVTPYAAAADGAAAAAAAVEEGVSSSSASASSTSDQQKRTDAVLLRALGVGRVRVTVELVAASSPAASLPSQAAPAASVLISVVEPLELRPAAPQYIAIGSSLPFRLARLFSSAAAAAAAAEQQQSSEDFQWSVGDDSVASVTNDGRLTALRLGHTDVLVHSRKVPEVVYATAVHVAEPAALSLRLVAASSTAGIVDDDEAHDRSDLPSSATSPDESVYAVAGHSYRLLIDVFAKGQHRMSSSTARRMTFRVTLSSSDDSGMKTETLVLEGDEVARGSTRLLRAVEGRAGQVLIKVELLEESDSSQQGGKKGAVILSNQLRVFVTHPLHIVSASGLALPSPVYLPWGEAVNNGSMHTLQLSTIGGSGAIRWSIEDQDPTSPVRVTVDDDGKLALRSSPSGETLSSVASSALFRATIVAIDGNNLQSVARLPLALVSLSRATEQSAAGSVKLLLSPNTADVAVGSSIILRASVRLAVSSLVEGTSAAAAAATAGSASSPFVSLFNCSALPLQWTVSGLDRDYELIDIDVTSTTTAGEDGSICGMKKLLVHSHSAAPIQVAVSLDSVATLSAHSSLAAFQPLSIAPRLSPSTAVAKSTTSQSDLSVFVTAPGSTARVRVLGGPSAPAGLSDRVQAVASKSELVTMKAIEDDDGGARGIVVTCDETPHQQDIDIRYPLSRVEPEHWFLSSSDSPPAASYTSALFHFRCEAPHALFLYSDDGGGSGGATPNAGPVAETNEADGDATSTPLSSVSGDVVHQLSGSLLPSLSWLSTPAGRLMALNDSSLASNYFIRSNSSVDFHVLLLDAAGNPFDGQDSAVFVWELELDRSKNAFRIVAVENDSSVVSLATDLKPSQGDVSIRAKLSVFRTELMKAPKPAADALVAQLPIRVVTDPENFVEPRTLLLLLDDAVSEEISFSGGSGQFLLALSGKGENESGSSSASSSLPLVDIERQSAGSFSIRPKRVGVVNLWASDARLHGLPPISVTVIVSQARKLQLVVEAGAHLPVGRDGSKVRSLLFDSEGRRFPPRQADQAGLRVVMDGAGRSSSSLFWKADEGEGRISGSRASAITLSAACCQGAVVSEPVSIEFFSSLAIETASAVVAGEAPLLLLEGSSLALRTRGGPESAGETIFSSSDDHVGRVDEATAQVHAGLAGDALLAARVGDDLAAATPLQLTVINPADARLAVSAPADRLLEGNSLPVQLTVASINDQEKKVPSSSSLLAFAGQLEKVCVAWQGSPADTVSLRIPPGLESLLMEESSCSPAGASADTATGSGGELLDAAWSGAVTAVIRGRQAGVVRVSSSARLPIDSHGRGADQTQTPPRSITVVRRLALLHPRMLLLPPGASVQLRTNFDDDLSNGGSSNGMLRYSIASFDNVKESSSNALASVTNRGLVTASSRPGETAVMVCEQSLDQQCVVQHVGVRPVHHILVIAGNGASVDAGGSSSSSSSSASSNIDDAGDNYLSTAADGGEGWIRLGVGESAKAQAILLDATGSPFAALGSWAPLHAAADQPAIVDCRAVANGTLELRGRRRGSALIRVWSELDSALSSWLRVEVVSRVHPRSPVIHSGGLIRFTTGIALRPRQRDQWFSDQLDVLTIQRLSGEAVARAPGEAVVTHRVGDVGSLSASLTSSSSSSSSSLKSKSVTASASSSSSSPPSSTTTISADDEEWASSTAFVRVVRASSIEIVVTGSVARGLTNARTNRTGPMSVYWLPLRVYGPNGELLQDSPPAIAQRLAVSCSIDEEQREWATARAVRAEDVARVDAVGADWLCEVTPQPLALASLRDAKPPAALTILAQVNASPYDDKEEFADEQFAASSRPLALAKRALNFIPAFYLLNAPARGLLQLHRGRPAAFLEVYAARATSLVVRSSDPSRVSIKALRTGAVGEPDSPFTTVYEISAEPVGGSIRAEQDAAVVESDVDESGAAADGQSQSESAGATQHHYDVDILPFDDVFVEFSNPTTGQRETVAVAFSSADPLDLASSLAAALEMAQQQQGGQPQHQQQQQAGLRYVSGVDGMSGDSFKMTESGAILVTPARDSSSWLAVFLLAILTLVFYFMSQSTVRGGNGGSGHIPTLGDLRTPNARRSSGALSSAASGVPSPNRYLPSTPFMDPAASNSNVSMLGSQGRNAPMTPNSVGRRTFRGGLTGTSGNATPSSFLYNKGTTSASRRTNNATWQSPGSPFRSVLRND